MQGDTRAKRWTTRALIGTCALAIGVTGPAILAHGEPPAQSEPAAQRAQRAEQVQQTQPGEKANAQSMTTDEVTLIGCLVRLDTSAWRAGTTDPIPAGHAGQLPSSGYALKDAIQPTGPVPESGPVQTRSEREFGLAKGDVSVDRFAGHQVVIKGRLASTPNSQPPADASPTPGHDSMIEVIDVRSLSPSCPPRG